MVNPEFCAVENKKEIGRSANFSLATENENPGALAGATGADQLGISFKTEQYRRRAEAATALACAIGECHPEDACEIMAAALESLSVGAPLPVFVSIMDDARWWASCASPAEIKAYALACFEAMRPKVRDAFLGYVQRGSA
jgi:hypothetical protein